MELILALLSGGATGIIGSVVGKVFGFLGKREERKIKVIDHAHIEKMQELNISARGRELEGELAIVDVDAMKSIRAESYRHDASYGKTGPIMSAVLRMVRPVLTFGILGVMTWIFFDLDPADTLVDANKLKAQIVNAVVYLATSSVTWWFGDRAPDWLRKKAG